jgi:16S rRNA C967 or C1407 C5-methylase (RsmB/RsmF family)
MKQKLKSKKLSGEEAFDSFYSSVYGERWSDLKNSLIKESILIRWQNSFAKNESALDQVTTDVEFTGIPRASNGLLSYYILDQASAWVAESLCVPPEAVVLDMCAAPGGKSVILANRLFDGNSSEVLERKCMGSLILNELSAGRRERLFKVVQNYIPRDVRNHVQITGKDGLRFGMIQPETYDAILLDAPCSGERHLLENKRELENWSENRTKGLAQKQYGLLTSALLALKPGGHLIYSTCSVSPFENDGVIAKLIKKKSTEGFSIRKDLLKRGIGAEDTEFGLMYLS